MEKNQTMPADVQEKIVTVFKARMKNFGVASFKQNNRPSKKYLDLQAEHLCAAVSTIDILLANENSCIPPGWFTALIRGEVI